MFGIWELTRIKLVPMLRTSPKHILPEWTVRPEFRPVPPARRRVILCKCWPMWSITVNRTVPSCHWQTTQNSLGARDGKHISRPAARRELGITWCCYRGGSNTNQQRGRHLSMLGRNKRGKSPWKDALRARSLTYCAVRHKMGKVSNNIHPGRLLIARQREEARLPTQEYTKDESREQQGKPRHECCGAWLSPVSKANEVTWERNRGWCENSERQVATALREVRMEIRSRCGAGMKVYGACSGDVVQPVTVSIWVATLWWANGGEGECRPYAALANALLEQWLRLERNSCRVACWLAPVLSKCNKVIFKKSPSVSIFSFWVSFIFTNTQIMQ